MRITIDLDELGTQPRVTTVRPQLSGSSLSARDAGAPRSAARVAGPTRANGRDGGAASIKKPITQAPERTRH